MVGYETSVTVDKTTHFMWLSVTQIWTSEILVTSWDCISVHSHNIHIYQDPLAQPVYEWKPIKFKIGHTQTHTHIQTKHTKKHTNKTHRTHTQSSGGEVMPFNNTQQAKPRKKHVQINKSTLSALVSDQYYHYQLFTSLHNMLSWVWLHQDNPSFFQKNIALADEVSDRQINTRKWINVANWLKIECFTVRS